MVCSLLRSSTDRNDSSDQRELILPSSPQLAVDLRFPNRRTCLLLSATFATQSAISRRLGSHFKVPATTSRAWAGRAISASPCCVLGSLKILLIAMPHETFFTTGFMAEHFT